MPVSKSSKLAKGSEGKAARSERQLAPALPIQSKCRIHFSHLSASLTCPSSTTPSPQTSSLETIARPQDTSSLPAMSSYFRITLLRSAIGLPTKTSGVLKALGLHKRMRTVYHPVSPDVAGQIFAVKELVDVQEVDQPLTKTEMRELRRPEKGWWVEKRAGAA